MSDKNKTIDSRMYVNVRVVGEGLAVCLRFDNERDGEQLPSIGLRRWSSGNELQFEPSLGEVLFDIMRVSGVDSLDKIQGRWVRVVVGQEDFPIELIHANNDRIRWRPL